MRVGQLIHLNDDGVELLWGHDKGLSYMKTLVMTITAIDPNGDIYVDNEEINKYRLRESMFTLVKKS